MFDSFGYLPIQTKYIPPCVLAISYVPICMKMKQDETDHVKCKS